MLHPDWDKLKVLKLSSVQRRNERFHIISYWKLVNGIVSGSEKFRTKEGRKGVTAVYPNSPRGTEPWVIKLRRNSFHYKVCLLFNSTPRWVREVREGRWRGSRYN